jgi:hypothetical protein
MQTSVCFRVSCQAVRRQRRLCVNWRVGASIDRGACVHQLCFALLLFQDILELGFSKVDGEDIAQGP